MSYKRLFVFTVLLFLIVAPTSIALMGNAFSGLTSTVGGYTTWDSDLINIERVSQTGAGVYVAVLDTGLVPNWADYFPNARIATQLGTGFDQSVNFSSSSDPCEFDVSVGPLRQTTYIGSTGSSHGTHVTSTIIGYFYQSNTDAAQGFPLPPIVVRGIAPDVTIIPVKVLADYQIPALPNCTNPGPTASRGVVFGTSEMVAAGIDYVTNLKTSGALGGHPVVINMSLGGAPDEPISAVEKGAVDRAVAAGVIVVAAAGNDGELGMDAPGSYAPVISAGAAGWTKEWQPITNNNRYRMWWLQAPDLLKIVDDVAEPTPKSEVYVTDFSARQHRGFDLDVLAPGSWVRGPFAGDPGYSHLPWWSNGIGDLVGHNPGNFFYVGGTSMATPHVASVAALMLQKNPGLNAATIENIMQSTALKIGAGSAVVWDLSPVQGYYTRTWGSDATGSGLLQADAAVAAS
jgi:subtilisin family serine protease